MSPPSMTRERFESLAEAYGGEPARWPADEREAAALMMAAEPAFARAVLGRAGGLDTALDAWRPQAPSTTLLERILASAPAARRPRFAWLSPAALAAGLAAACAAGVAFGVALSEGTSATNGSEQVAASTLTLEPSLDLEGA